MFALSDVWAKKYAKLTGALNTRYPGLEAGEKATIRDAKYYYIVKADGYQEIIDHGTTHPEAHFRKFLDFLKPGIGEGITEEDLLRDDD